MRVSGRGTFPPAGAPLLARADLQRFVVHLRERGVKPISCNCWVRAMNSFATWLHERGAISESVRICPQKVEKRLLAVHTETALRTILSYRPKTYIQWRVYAIACAIPDAGCRIDELLSVSIGDFDFDNLLLTVVGRDASSEGFRSPLNFEDCYFGLVK